MGATRKDDPKLATVQREIAELEAAQRWGREHPFAGVCGEDDARADRLADLRAELAVLLRAGWQQTRPPRSPSLSTWNRP